MESYKVTMIGWTVFGVVAVVALSLLVAFGIWQHAESVRVFLVECAAMGYEMIDGNCLVP